MTNPTPTRDFSDIRGHSPAILDTIKSAVRSHVAGAPTVLLLNGPPGTGKTMIAARVPGILPAMTEHERTWHCAEYEAVGMACGGRPFRAPHCTVSVSGLIGGSRAVVSRVGELGLARFGVLFLDEMIEFRLSTLEALGHACRAMAGRPLIAAASNSCPCGWSGSTARECSCSPGARKGYADRVAKSLTAIGGARATVICADVASLSLDDMRHGMPWPSSATIAAEIAAV